jgi:NAD(P)-dependent dehydrogenase (short-subunit alcohol dehydrogenase family)
MQEQKVALVTGSSSGIGFETALILARNGYHTYASMRNIKKSQKIMEIANNENLSLQIVELDVNNDKSVKDAIDKIISEKNRIDVLVNNAGYGLFGPLEELTLEQIRAQFETNFFGVIRVIQNALPTMRKQKDSSSDRSYIVNISSVGGRMSVPILSAYNSSKFALEGLSESLSYELDPFDIRVVLIEPGFIKTNIMNSSIVANKSLDQGSPYFTLTQKISKHFNSMLNSSSATDPKEVAKTILNAIRSESPKLRYTVGNDAHSIIQAKKAMSDEDFENLIKKQFQ